MVSGWESLLAACDKDPEHCQNRRDVVVHIKYVCEPALEALPRAAHVYDPLDRGADHLGLTPDPLWKAPTDARICGALAHNEAHAKLLRRRVARLRHVWHVPHHAMPPCTDALEDDEVALRELWRRRTVAVIGGSPSAQLRERLDALSTTADVLYDIPVLYENESCNVSRGAQSLACLCTLLKTHASVAVAWDQLSGTQTNKWCLDTTGLGANGCLALKPNERLVNPLAAGVPTVGFSGFASFREAVARVQLDSEQSMEEPLLASSLAELDDRLAGLLTNFSAWRAARRRGIAIGERFQLEHVLPSYEEAVRGALAAKERGEC